MTRKRIRTPSPTDGPMMRSVIQARYWKQRDKAAKDIQRAFRRHKMRKARKARQQASPGYKPRPREGKGFSVIRPIRLPFTDRPDGYGMY